jgi:hypothetical protein
MARNKHKEGSVKAVAKAIKVVPTKLDIGCGPNKREGFHGVDSIAFKGVDSVFDVRKAPWPWKDDSISEVHCSHFLEHLNSMERVLFFNELYRVLEKGGKAAIITPHWASNRAFGDPTHQWPPVSEMAYFYIDRGWRKANAPHIDIEHNKDGFKCDFMATWGYGMNQALLTKNQEYQSFALSWYKEAAQDLHANLVKR